MHGRSSKIKARLYHSCTAFERDLALVVSNCRAYNEPESIYCTAAAELETWGAKLFAHLRNTDMLPPDDPTYSSDDDESSSTDSSEDKDEDGNGMAAGNSFIAPAGAVMSAERAPPNAAGWRQSATAFLHDQQSQLSAAAAQAAGRTDITAELHGGNSSFSAEDSSDDSTSSDGEVENMHHGESALSVTSGGRSVAAAPAPTGVVDHGVPRFTLGPNPDL